MRKIIIAALFLYALLIAEPISTHVRYIQVNLMIKPSNGLKARLQGMVAGNIYKAYSQDILIENGSSIFCTEIQLNIPTQCETRIITPLGRNFIFEAYWEKIGNNYYVTTDKI